MALDQSLVDAAIQQALSRFPSGYAGAAAIRTETGQILTSVCFDPPNSGAGLCHETGAFCEANRLGERVVATVCVSRNEPDKPFLILAPCGICQERQPCGAPMLKSPWRYLGRQASGKRNDWQSYNRTTGVMPWRTRASEYSLKRSPCYFTQRTSRISALRCLLSWSWVRLRLPACG
jgi:cytidine deaminase